MGFPVIHENHVAVRATAGNRDLLGPATYFDKMEVKTNVINHIVLDPEQEQLFCDFVEAERRVPRAQREHFIITNPIGPNGVCLIHQGWIDQNRRVFEGDIDALIRAGLLLIAYPAPEIKGFYVSPEGFRYYSEIMRKRGEAMQRVQQSVCEYIQSSTFQARYPSTYAKWFEAEALLYSEDSDDALTTIGHLIREAMQEFASTLVNRFEPSNTETDKTKTVARIKAVLRNQKLSNNINAFLDALITYWGTLADLVQRQEHGALKEGETLKWLDARRIVFQLAVIIMEIDAVVSS